MGERRKLLFTIIARLSSEAAILVKQKTVSLQAIKIHCSTNSPNQYQENYQVTSRKKHSTSIYFHHSTYRIDLNTNLSKRIVFK